MIGKILRPIVEAGGKPLKFSALTVCEQPTSPVRATLSLQGKCPLDAGAPLSVSAGPLSLFNGVVTGIHVLRASDGPLFTIEAHRQDAAWLTQSRREVKQKTSALLARLLGRIDRQAAPACDELHPSLTLLCEEAWPLAARLALLSGRFLLNSAAGPRLVRPDQPRTPQPLPRGAIVELRNGLAPELELATYRPGHWGEVLTVKRRSQRAHERLRLFVEEAVSAQQLNAAADAILAAEHRGALHADAGPQGLAIEVGDWLEVEGRPHCVTARRCAWHENGGWTARLMGEYPWRRHATQPSAPAAEPAVVKGFDEETGAVKVLLPWHDDLEILAGLRTDRAAKNDFALQLPNIGDAGLVLFVHGAEHALYVGAPLAAGSLSAEDFAAMISIVRSKQLDVTHAVDGKVVQHVQTQTATARRFEFNKA